MYNEDDCGILAMHCDECRNQICEQCWIDTCNECEKEECDADHTLNPERCGALDCVACFEAGDAFPCVECGIEDDVCENCDELDCEGPGDVRNRRE